MEAEPNYTYVSQNDRYYEVRDTFGSILKFPKNREVYEKYPVKISGSLKRLYKLLFLSVVGLLTSGPLNILISPFVVSSYRSVPISEKAEAKNVLYSFLTILFLSIILSVIFTVHIIY